jgi:ribosomal protein S14
MGQSLKYNIPLLKQRKILKEYISRKMFLRSEFFYIFLKFLLKNRFINKQTRVLAIFYLVSYYKKQSKTRLSNICLYSGHRRSVNTSLSLNRMSVLEYSNKLLLPGFQKAYW